MRNPATLAVLAVGLSVVPASARERAARQPNVESTAAIRDPNPITESNAAAYAAQLRFENRVRAREQRAVSSVCESCRGRQGGKAARPVSDFFRMPDREPRPRDPAQATVD